MKRLLCLGLIVCLLLSVTACGSGKKDLTAVIRYYSVFESSWEIYMPEDEEEDSVVEEKKAPEYETVLLKKGENIESDVYVKSITDQVIMVAYDPHYIVYIYDAKTEEFIKETGKKGNFLLKVGEKAVMYDTGICDASYTIYLILDEIN